MEEEKSNKSTETGQDEPMVEQLIATGRRCLACGDVTNASMALQQACELLSEKHGDLSSTLAEPYFLYGKALLGVARNEASVLGAGVPVPQEESTESSDDEEEEGEERANEEEQEPSSTNDQERTATGDCCEQLPDPPPWTAADDCCQEPPDPPPAGDGAVPASDPAVGTEEEEPTSLQLAWEVLELARVLYQREETGEGRLKLAEVNMVLGEVSLESDLYERGVEDFTTCLQLREAVLDPTDRRLAEAHFQLGLAYTLAKQTDDAVDEYVKARQVLLLRKEVLENKLASLTDADERASIEEEVKEIDAIIPDIESKISDVEDMQEAAKELESSVEKDEEEESTTIGFGSFSSSARKSAPPQVMDISHLVRKRPTDDKVNGDAKRWCKDDDTTSATPQEATLTKADSSQPTQTAEL